MVPAYEAGWGRGWAWGAGEHRHVWGRVRGRPGMQGPVGVGRGGVGVCRVSQGMNAGCGRGVDMSGCMGVRGVGCVQGVSGARTWAGVRVSVEACRCVGAEPRPHYWGLGPGVAVTWRRAGVLG